LLQKCYPCNIGQLPAVNFSSRPNLERIFSFFKVPYRIDKQGYGA
jgi:hypothetical protein